MKGSSILAGTQHHGSTAGSNLADKNLTIPDPGLTLAGNSLCDTALERSIHSTSSTHPAWVLLPKGAKRTFVILSLALVGCQGNITPAAPTPDVVTLRLFADHATSPLLRDLANSYRPPGVILSWDIQVGDTRSVIDWLRQGSDRASYALTDYLPSDFEQGGSTGLKTLWATPVGQDGIALVVNPANPLSGLNASQIRLILQGRTTNWRDLGGPDLPLTVVAQSTRSGESALLQAMALGDRRLTQAARLAPTSAAVVDLVAADAGAIGYVSIGYLAGASPKANAGVRAVPVDGTLPTPENVAAQRYAITTPIVFAGLNEPPDDAYRAFFAWVQSPDGQAIVRQHYGGLSNS